MTAEALVIVAVLIGVAFGAGVAGGMWVQRPKIRRLTAENNEHAVNNADLKANLHDLRMMRGRMFAKASKATTRAENLAREVADLKVLLTDEQAAHDLTRAERDKARDELAGGMVLPLYAPVTDSCLPPLDPGHADVDLDDEAPIFDDMTGAPS